MNNTEKGRRGESIAESYLINKGYTLIARNYRAGKSEIDLIMKDGETTVFVEVKARAGYDYGSGLEAITKRKIAMIISGAEAFCKEHSLFESSIRFDAVEVDLKEGRAINHIQSAFCAEA